MKTVAAALLVGAGSLSLGACATDPEPTAKATPAATHMSAAPTSTSSATSTLPPGVDQVVAITVRDGDVIGVASRVKVETGSTVQIRVTSDVADEVHLHGYDKSVDVRPGHLLRLPFKASIPGVFEVELESRKQRLTQLQVQ